MNPKLKKLVVVGGGTAGWLSAVYLQEQFKKQDKQVELALLEPSNIPTIGVGEGTVDSFIDLLENAGVDIQEFIRESKGSLKHGIRFKDWLELNSEYWHPFYADSMSSEDIFKLLLTPKPFHDIFFNTRLAKNSRSAFSPDRRVATGLHFDSKLVAAYLKKLCISRGCKLIDAEVQGISRTQDGSIEKILCNDGIEVSADFFIDASGFRSLIIGKEFQTPFVDFSKYLICDQAITLQKPYAEGEVREAYTTSSAQKFGWSWKIPTYNRTGFGYVFSSQFATPDSLHDEFSKRMNLPKDHNYKFGHVKFRVGHYEQSMVKNCMAIGLSSGFIEPLEATGLLFVSKGLQALSLYFKDEINSSEINRLMSNYYNTTRDFIFLHYKLTKRNDTDFWNHVREIPTPPSLQERLNILKGCIGKLEENRIQFVKDLLFPWDLRAYVLILHGMGFYQNSLPELADIHDDIVDSLDKKSENFERLDPFLDKLNEAI